MVEQQEKQFCQLLKLAIEDEKKAPIDYQKLIDSKRARITYTYLNNMPSEPISKTVQEMDKVVTDLVIGIISDIMQDEKKHDYRLNTIYDIFCR